MKLAFQGAGGKEVELEILTTHFLASPNLPFDPFQRGGMCDIERVRSVLDRNRPALFVAQHDLRQGDAGLINKLRQRIFLAPVPANKWTHVVAGELTVLTDVIKSLAELIV